MVQIPRENDPFHVPLLTCRRPFGHGARRIGREFQAPNTDQRYLSTLPRWVLTEESPVPRRGVPEQGLRSLRLVTNRSLGTQQPTQCLQGRNYVRVRRAGSAVRKTILRCAQTFPGAIPCGALAGRSYQVCREGSLPPTRAPLESTLRS